MLESSYSNSGLQAPTLPHTLSKHGPSRCTIPVDESKLPASKKKYIYINQQRRMDMSVRNQLRLDGLQESARSCHEPVVLGHR